MKEKLEKCQHELETARKANELDILPFSSFTQDRCIPLKFPCKLVQRCSHLTLLARWALLIIIQLHHMLALDSVVYCLCHSVIKPCIEKFTCLFVCSCVL